VVASLWRVDDEVTEEFMNYFYEDLLQNNMTASEALRNAQMRLRENETWSAPYYWAPFIIIERDRTLANHLKSITKTEIPLLKAP
jgi:CHAT domain-containing protein